MEQQENAQPVFTIEKIYVKDMSVEVPNSPQIFKEAQNPDINVEMSTNATALEDTFYEVVLSITVTAKIGEDKTAFLVEASQAGIFHIQNIPEENMQAVLMIGGPNILFPYVRETISNAVVRAGFQPVMLSPINFEALYESRQQQLAQAAGNA